MDPRPAVVDLLLLVYSVPHRSVGLLASLRLTGAPQAADLLLVAEVVAGRPAILLFAGQLPVAGLRVDLRPLCIDSFFAAVGLLPVGILVGEVVAGLVAVLLHAAQLVATGFANQQRGEGQ